MLHQSGSAALGLLVAAGALQPTREQRAFFRSRLPREFTSPDLPISGHQGRFFDGISWLVLLRLLRGFGLQV